MAKASARWRCHFRFAALHVRSHNRLAAREAAGSGSEQLMYAHRRTRPGGTSWPSALLLYALLLIWADP